MIFKFASTLLVLSMLAARYVEMTQQDTQTSYNLKYNINKELGIEKFYQGTPISSTITIERLKF